MADPKHPPPDDETPMPASTWKPTIVEPDPDLLPDGRPEPNPDENDDPPVNVRD